MFVHISNLWPNRRCDNLLFSLSYSWEEVHFSFNSHTITVNICNVNYANCSVPKRVPFRCFFLFDVNERQLHHVKCALKRICWTKLNFFCRPTHAHLHPISVCFERKHHFFSSTSRNSVTLWRIRRKHTRTQLGRKHKFLFSGGRAETKSEKQE